MKGEIETGTCAVCGKENVDVLRTVIHFPYIECECHNNHFILIRHCAECKPEVPAETTVKISVTKLRALCSLVSNHTREYIEMVDYLETRKNDYLGWDSHITKSHPKTTPASSSCEAMYLDD